MHGTSSRRKTTFRDFHDPFLLFSFDSFLDYHATSFCYAILTRHSIPIFIFATFWPMHAFLAWLYSFHNPFCLWGHHLCFCTCICHIFDLLAHILCLYIYRLIPTCLPTYLPFLPTWQLLPMKRKSTDANPSILDATYMLTYWPNKFVLVKCCHVSASHRHETIEHPRYYWTVELHVYISIACK